MLVLLLGVPFLVLGYLALVRRSRPRRAAERPGLRADGVAQRRRRRRHVPFAVFLVAVIVALIALADRRRA